MIAFPEVQLQAQAEIDAVVGRDRLPTFADAPRLPYVCAIIKEILRWRPAAPFAIPHATAEGTICISNIWHCNHDRAVFGEDADKVRPERHLDEHGELLPGPIPGRTYRIRVWAAYSICVGNELAVESLFINTVRILWATKLERTRDENEKDVPVDTETIVDAGII